MSLERTQPNADGKKSIFRSLFVPLFLLMALQAVIFYFAAVYGGVEESLSQNAADILNERLFNRKNELETQLNSRSFDLEACMRSINDSYAAYEAAHGAKPLSGNQRLQIDFLSENADVLIETLRHSEGNGVFLIINDLSAQEAFSASGEEKKYGLCIRDLDQESNYFGREDLLLERAPSSIIDSLGCSLDSWWEARYTFSSEESGDYYYNPLNAAWENPRSKGSDLAYISGVNRPFGSDQAVISYSVPLISSDGYPYAVLGVELTTRYIASLLPESELSEQGNSSYVLAMREAGSTDCAPLVGTGALFSRWFASGSALSCSQSAPTGGFTIAARGGAKLYGDAATLDVYNNNNPFEGRELVLLALTESDAMFAHIDQIKLTLFVVSLLSLALGVLGIVFVSRRFASPITALADRVRDMKPEAGFSLDRLGIEEIDQLVDSIEELNKNVSRNSARTEFFSRMSHDMRTPMNAIIGFSSPELLEGADEATKDDYLKKIHASGDYLLGLINEVLDMTKIESNKTALKLAPVPAKRLCETTIPIIEKLAQKRNISFLSKIEAADGVYVAADSQCLDQVLMNLLSNAVKFTPEGGDVTLTVSVGDEAAEDGALICRIVVSDNGVGMSEEFMKKLFVPFEQENSTREGTGLGLSIAQKLVELMGGTIECKSLKNIGTTFTVCIPMQRAEEAPQLSKPERIYERAELKRLAGKRVLVCEDNSLNAQIVCNLLDKAGVAADVAENGSAGVAAFAASESGYYDAVLMDVLMPVMDGLSAARAIRELARADAASVPIIAMTANAFDEDVLACKAAGMNEHLAKPVDTQRFFEVLLRYLAPEAGA